MATPTQEWYTASVAQARADHDLPTLQLAALYDQSTNCMETDPDQALTLLAQGQTSAQQQGKLCWALFFVHWQVAANIFNKQDFKTGLDLAVRAAVEAQKPIYQDCPHVPWTQIGLLDAYIRTDPISYETQMRDTIAYLQTHFGNDAEIRQLMLGRLYYLEMVMSRYEEAHQLALKFLAEAGKDNRVLMWAYQLLTDDCYRLNMPSDGLEYAQTGETLARRQKHHLRALASFCAWQTLFLRQSGDRLEARRLHNVAQTYAAQIGAKLYESYYNALCAYYELEEQFDRALRLRDAELVDVLESNSLYDEAKIRVWRMRLLAKMGLPIDQELAAARVIVSKMEKPAYYLAKIDQVLSGDLSDRW